jgi:hypothetical protein
MDEAIQTSTDSLYCRFLNRSITEERPYSYVLPVLNRHPPSQDDHHGMEFHENLHLNLDHLFAKSRIYQRLGSQQYADEGHVVGYQ